MIGIASSIGLLFKKGIPKKVSNAAMVVSGTCTLYIGITGSLSGENVTIAEGIISAFCAGSMIGTNLMGDYKNESCG